MNNNKSMAAVVIVAVALTLAAATIVTVIGQEAFAGKPFPGKPVDPLPPPNKLTEQACKNIEEHAPREVGSRLC